MISEAYELFGCNTADLFVLSVNTGDTDAECIQFDQTYGIEFPCISGVEGGGTAINNSYSIGAYPTYILIAPDHSIVEQDIWPIPNVQTFITAFENNGVVQAECGGLTAGFNSDVTEICQFEMVNFMDNSSGDITGWNWTFEGGEPATSTEQNPVVTYNTSGTFDVELEITDGANTNSLLLEDYVTVNEAPPVMLMPFSMVCLTWPAIELSGGSPAGGVYAGPGVVDGYFHPDVAGIGTHMISYTFTGLSGCSNTTEESIVVDPCTGINEVSSNDLNIYPNPNTGAFSIVAPTKGNYQIMVYDIAGNVVYNEDVAFSTGIAHEIILEEVEEGMYFVSLISSETTMMSKVNILKD